MDTINRLLKKQPPKRRGRLAAAETGAEGTPDVAPEPPKADPTMIRWVSTRDAFKVAVPEELFETPVARAFGQVPPTNGNRKLVEEV
jgi:Ino eighty subunit 2